MSDISFIAVMKRCAYDSTSFRRTPEPMLSLQSCKFSMDPAFAGTTDLTLPL